MTKAEEILTDEFAAKFSNPLVRIRILNCINASLEWAATQVEEGVYGFSDVETVAVQDVIAGRIREGKTK